MARSRARDDIEIEQDPNTSKPANDAYTGMLGISLAALVGGAVLLYLDYSQYPDKNPPKVTPFAAAPKDDPPPPPPPPAEKKDPEKKPDDPKKDDEKKDEVKN